MNRSEIANRKNSAYHEAGHAVFARLRGHDVAYINISPDGDTPGHCEIAWNSPTFDDVILVALGGIRGEQVRRKRLTHAGRMRGANDYTEALSSLKNELPHRDDNFDLRLGRWFQWEAKKIADRPEVREAITAIADALLQRETLTGDEVLAICDAAGVVPE